MRLWVWVKKRWQGWRREEPADLVARLCRKGLVDDDMLRHAGWKDERIKVLRSAREGR